MWKEIENFCVNRFQMSRSANSLRANWSIVVSRPVAGRIPRKKEKAWQSKERKKEQRGRKIVEVRGGREAGSRTLVGVLSRQMRWGHSDFRLWTTSKGKS